MCLRLGVKCLKGREVAVGEANPVVSDGKSGYRGRSVAVRVLLKSQLVTLDLDADLIDLALRLFDGGDGVDNGLEQSV